LAEILTSPAARARAPPALGFFRWRELTSGTDWAPCSRFPCPGAAGRGPLWHRRPCPRVSSPRLCSKRQRSSVGPVLERARVPGPPARFRVGALLLSGALAGPALRRDSGRAGLFRDSAWARARRSRASARRLSSLPRLSAALRTWPH